MFLGDSGCEKSGLILNDGLFDMGLAASMIVSPIRPSPARDDWQRQLHRLNVALNFRLEFWILWHYIASSRRRHDFIERLILSM